jgi:predicted MFS family arabinose efflux permease
MSTKVTGIEREEHATNQLFLLVVALAVFVTTLTGSMVDVLIPVMRAEFASSAAHVTWVMTATVLAYAIGVPLYGRVSDYYRVRSILILGLLRFASGGILCAVARSLVVLVGDCLETHSHGAFWTEPETEDHSPR